MLQKNQGESWTLQNYFLALHCLLALILAHHSGLIGNCIGPPCPDDTRESDRFSQGSRFPVTEFWLHQGAPSFTALDRQGPIMWEIFPETWIWSHFLQVPPPSPLPPFKKRANIFWEQGPRYPCFPGENGVPKAWGHQGWVRLTE